MSVEFDPVRLDRGRRRLEPVAIGVVVVVVAVGAAIAKPWDAAPTSESPAASLVAIAATERSPAPAPTASPRVTPSPPDWTGVKNAVTPHDAWGVTAVLVTRRASTGIPVSPPDTRYLERWAPTSPDPAGDDVAYVNREDRAIAALGVTVPDGVQPRAVRIWRIHDGNELEWINAARIDNLATTVAPLLVRLPLDDGGTAMAWDAGQYRMDVLTSSGIHRISVMIPNRFGNVPRPDDWATTQPDTVSAAASDPSAIRVGLFATVDGAAVSIPARESGPLGEIQAWRAVALADGSTVAATYLPRATGLGVMLTSHAAVGAASIRRLAPEPLDVAPPPSGGISDAQGRTPFVVFQAPGGGVWTPGVYALTVDWEDAAGPHHGTWHVELRPGAG